MALVCTAKQITYPTEQSSGDLRDMLSLTIVIIMESDCAEWCVTRKNIFFGKVFLPAYSAKVGSELTSNNNLCVYT